jgi:hypothetical protein
MAAILIVSSPWTGVTKKNMNRKNRMGLLAFSVPSAEFESCRLEFFTSKIMILPPYGLTALQYSGFPFSNFKIRIQTEELIMWTIRRSTTIRWDGFDSVVEEPLQVSWNRRIRN